jgi:hypothetical protein
MRKSFAHLSGCWLPGAWQGCGENIPAMVETLPSSWIAVKCPLCGEHRRYLPSEVFQGRVSYQLLKKPVRSVQGGAR